MAKSATKTQPGGEPVPASTVGGGSAESGAGHFMLSPRPYNVTIPPPDDFYFVREDQLEQLTEPSKEYSLEIGLASTFGAAGFIQNVFSVIGAITSEKAISTSDASLSLIGIVCLVIGVTKLIQWNNRKSSTNTLLTQIKSGQKAKIGT
jgi:hypothetical protein